MSNSVANPCESGLPVTVEWGPASLTAGTEVLVASEAGPYSCADVWCNVPLSWVDRVTARLYARLGAARILLRQVPLRKVQLAANGATHLSGLAVSIRGRPCSAFELTLEASTGDILQDGTFYLQVWHSATEPSSAGGAVVPEVEAPLPMVAAALVGRDSASGALTEVSTDSAGRLIVANPYFTEADKAKLDAATPLASTNTLVSRDGDGGSAFYRLELEDVERDPGAGALSPEGICLWSRDGQLRANGHGSTVTEDLSTQAPIELGDARRFRRARTVEILDATTTRIELLGAGEVPAGDWSGRITVEFHIYNADKIGAAGGCRKATLEQTPGPSLAVVTSAANQEIGVTDGTSGFASATIVADSGAIELSIVTNDRQSLHVTAWADIVLVPHERA